MIPLTILRLKRVGIMNPGPANLKSLNPTGFPAVLGLLDADYLYQVLSVNRDVESLDSANQQQVGPEELESR